MISFKVFLGNKEIDQLFYGDDFLKGFKNLTELKDYIKSGLINHDGYNSNIWLKATK